MNHSNQLFGNVHAIETMGAFDGPGIRYVLFLQGCPFQCQYCHNRDSWSTKTNRLMSVDEIITDYQTYKSFYKKGGLTVSGGEPLLQLPFLIELFKRAKNEGIHTCLDTSAGCYKKDDERYLELIKYTDLVLLDMKQINAKKHVSLTGNHNEQVLEFARFLDFHHVKTIVRHVLVPTLTDDEKDLTDLRNFLDSLSNIINIEVLPYHRSGIHKWDQLGIAYPIPEILEPQKQEVLRAEVILKGGYRFVK
ncbi:MAG: pyruvate formate-lyase-activating protein [Acholeplasmataceae bacterium]|jgi:pyruvate formate lyase activating enzyme|nr:pyruvate formate-lyase-activating protein [Acholeplasmataceae bacterium]